MLNDLNIGDSVIKIIFYIVKNGSKLKDQKSIILTNKTSGWNCTLWFEFHSICIVVIRISTSVRTKHTHNAY